MKNLLNLFQGKIIIIILFVLFTAFVFLSNFSVFFDYSELSIVNSKLLCKVIIDDFNSNKCLIKLAKYRKDETVCDEIKRVPTSEKTIIKLEETRSACYWNVAVAKKDILLCDKAIKYKDRCIAGVAASTGDVSYCDKLPDKKVSIWDVDKEYCLKKVQQLN